MGTDTPVPPSGESEMVSYTPAPASENLGGAAPTATTIGEVGEDASFFDKVSAKIAR